MISEELPNGFREDYIHEVENTVGDIGKVKCGKPGIIQAIKFSFFFYKKKLCFHKGI